MTGIGKKQVPRNLSMNILSFIINALIGLWLVRYLIGNLGIAAYGLVPLAMAFSEYISLVSQSFNSATNRFLTIELQNKENKESANIIFNTSLYVIFFFSLMQSIISVLLLANLKDIVSIPDNFYIDALWLFGLTFLGFIFALISSIFSISMYSQNRIDLMRINDISRVLVRTATVVLLFVFFSPSLKFVGIGNLLGGMTILFLSIVRWRTLTPTLKINVFKADIRQIKRMGAMAGWVLINQVGYLLFLRIDMYVVNRFIGPEACGEYAAVLQWSQMVRSTAGVLSGAITPLGMIYFARGEIHKLVRMMKFAVKLMGISLAIPLAFLCVFSEQIITIWIGSEFSGLGRLMVLQLCPLVINLGVLPLFTINTALNRVKTPALFSCVLGFVNFGLAVWFANFTDYGYYGIAAAGIAVLTFKNAIFTPLYAAKLLELPKMSFLKPLLSGILAFLLLFALGFLFAKNLPFNNYIERGVIIGSISVLSIFPIMWFSLTQEEKSIIVDMFPLSMNKYARRLLLLK